MAIPDVAWHRRLSLALFWLRLATTPPSPTSGLCLLWLCILFDSLELVTFMTHIPIFTDYLTCKPLQLLPFTSIVIAKLFFLFVCLLRTHLLSFSHLVYKVATRHLWLLSTWNVTDLYWDVMCVKCTPDFENLAWKKANNLNNFLYWLHAKMQLFWIK